MSSADIRKRRALGRGLDSLLPPPPTPARETTAVSSIEPSTVAIEKLRPHASQPRTQFDEAALDELAKSLKEVGFLEPILVRPVNEAHAHDGVTYEIVAGERRWRAAQRAGIHNVPVYIRNLSDKEAMEAALVENLQRTDLNPIETARAYQRLMSEHGHTQDFLAKRLSKDRSSISNTLRLLKLPVEVLDLVEQGTLSEGHARALLTTEEPAAQRRLAHEAVQNGWSVREVERRSRSSKPGTTNKAAGKSVNVRDLETKLTQRLGTKVTIAERRGKGYLKIAYRDYDQLDAILAKLGAR